MLFDDEMEELLKTAHVIAIVGLSPEEGKASNSVARYLKEKGYRIIPVNPGHTEILGRKPTNHSSTYRRRSISSTYS